MAKKHILVSDISGAPVDQTDAVKVVITAANGKRYELDAALAEVSELVSNARETKKRGRPKKAS